MKALYAVAAAAGVVTAWSPSSAQVPSRCDKLAGEERKLCLMQERQRDRERIGREEDGKPRSCDELFGPAKEICLKRGGTVRAGVGSGVDASASGGSAAPSHGAATR